MTRYETLKNKPKRFLALTGYTLKSSRHSLGISPSDFWHPSKQKRLRETNLEKSDGITHYKNSCLPSLEDKLLFILIYLRKAMTQDILAELFGTSQPVANKWIHRLLPVVNRALADLGEWFPSRETSPTTFDKSAEPSTDDQVSNPFFS